MTKKKTSKLIITTLSPISFNKFLKKKMVIDLLCKIEQIYMQIYTNSFTNYAFKFPFQIKTNDMFAAVLQIYSRFMDISNYILSWMCRLQHNIFLCTLFDLTAYIHQLHTYSIQHVDSTERNIKRKKSLNTLTAHTCSKPHISRFAKYKHQTIIIAHTIRCKERKQSRYHHAFICICSTST